MEFLIENPIDQRVAPRNAVMTFAFSERVAPSRPSEGSAVHGVLVGGDFDGFELAMTETCCPARVIVAAGEYQRAAPLEDGRVPYIFVTAQLAEEA